VRLLVYVDLPLSGPLSVLTCMGLGADSAGAGGADPVRPCERVPALQPAPVALPHLPQGVVPHLLHILTLTCCMFEQRVCCCWLVCRLM